MAFLRAILPVLYALLTLDRLAEKRILGSTLFFASLEGLFRDF